MADHNTALTNKRDNFPRKVVAQLTGSNGPIHAVSYSASPGSYILTGSADRSVRLYNPSSTTANATTTTTSSSYITKPTNQSPQQGGIPEGKLIQTYSAHGYEVLSLSVASDNARFVSAGGDRAVFLWDVATAQTTRRFQGHVGRVNTVCFAGQDDSLVVSGGLDTTVKIWDLRAQGSTKPVQTLSEAKDSITSVAVPSHEAGGGGAEVIVGSVDGRVRTYDVRMGRLTTDVLPASVTSLCLSRDARTLLVGTLDSKVRLMDRRDGGCLRTYYSDNEEMRWRNEELRVQSVMGGGERWVVAGDEMTASSSSSSATSAEGKGNNEGRVWAWDLLTGKLVDRLAVPWGPSKKNTSVVIGRDGKEKERKNVVSCIAWKEGGFGNQFCVGGTSGVVTVFGEG